MRSLCWKFRLHAALAVIVAMGAFARPARAELVGSVNQFLTDRDRLIAQGDLIAADRAAFAVDLDNDVKLRQDVRLFFAHRAQAYALRLLKASDRKLIKVDLNYKGTKIKKPTKTTGVLLTDATSFITNYDAWTALQVEIDGILDQMKTAAANNDVPTLTTVTTSFFDKRRLRHEKRLQWQMDIRSMKKDISFKGTGKALKPTGSTLRDFVVEFLADRAAWEALGATIQADINNLRAALATPDSLTATVTTFLTDRRARRIKGNELAFDRDAMRKIIKPKEREKQDKKSGAEASMKDEDIDDESDALEDSSDEAGEK